MANLSGKPDGDLRQTGWQDMLPHTLQGSHYNEFWSYHFFLQDDLHLHLTFSLANFGSLKSPVSGGKLFVSNFNGQNYNIAREYPLEYFTVDEGQQKIRLREDRDIYLSGELPHEHHVYFRTSKDGISYLVDLDLHDIHPGYTGGDGIFRLGEDDMGIFIHIPRASVSGVVAINEDTLQVSGTAYMDHTFQTDLTSKVFDMGFRHISHAGDGFQVGYYLIPSRRSGDEVVGFSLTRKNSPLILEVPSQVTVLDSDRIDGKSVPRHIEIVYESGNRSLISREFDFQHVSFLEEMGGIRRRLVRSFLGGEVIEYVGTGKKDGSISINYNFFMVH
ncbi:MAG: hypothetical protein R6U28_13340 [Cyclonatronaceae bacterium]